MIPKNETREPTKRALTCITGGLKCGASSAGRGVDLSARVSGLPPKQTLAEGGTIFAEGPPGTQEEHLHRTWFSQKAQYLSLATGFGFARRIISAVRGMIHRGC